MSKTARNDNKAEEKKGAFNSAERANSECVNSDSQSSGDEELLKSAKDPIAQLNSMTVGNDELYD